MFEISREISVCLRHLEFCTKLAVFARPTVLFRNVICQGKNVTCPCEYVTCLCKYVSCPCEYVTCICKNVTCLCKYITSLCEYFTCTCEYVTCLSEYVTCTCEYVSCLCEYVTCTCEYVTCWSKNHRNKFINLPFQVEPEPRYAGPPIFCKKKFFCNNSFALLRELLLKNKFSRCVLNCTSHRRNKVTSFKKFLYPYSRRLSCAYVLKSTEGKNNKERWAKCTISLKGQSDEKSTATRRRLSHPQKKYKNKIYYIL